MKLRHFLLIYVIVFNVRFLYMNTYVTKFQESVSLIIFIY